MSNLVAGPGWMGCFVFVVRIRTRIWPFTRCDDNDTWITYPYIVFVL